MDVSGDEAFLYGGRGSVNKWTSDSEERHQEKWLAGILQML